MSTEEMLPLDTARARMADVMEELGAVAMHLREAMECAEAGNLRGALVSAGDAPEVITSAMEELDKMRDLTWRWILWAEGKEEA